MKRRDFIKYGGAALAAAAFGPGHALAKWIDTTEQGQMPRGMLVIDAHAHPRVPTACAFTADNASALENIAALKMNASCFSVVTDSTNPTLPVFPYPNVLNSLKCLVDLETSSDIRIIRRHSDLPRDIYSLDYAPGALLALEGAVFIQDEPGKLDELYDLGVRLVTVMHYQRGELGDIMTQAPFHGGLTAKGKAIVEKMCSLGLIIDCAHAHVNTLGPITEMAVAHGRPVIDSHTGLTRSQEPQMGRRRTFYEMEMIARTGGVVCIWPVSYGTKTEFRNWAGEIRLIADEIGIEHVGLGTDGGGIGNAAPLINGYSSVLDLPNLVAAMYDFGFKRSEIDAFFGGNMLRVMKAYL
jgi:microsomal dipeptidase-like Zn-dependent dipeptidase